jgi:hypothetical protein
VLELRGLGADRRVEDVLDRPQPRRIHVYSVLRSSP